MVQSRNAEVFGASGLGSRELKIGTLRSTVKQLGIDWREFNDA